MIAEGLVRSRQGRSQHFLCVHLKQQAQKQQQVREVGNSNGYRDNYISIALVVKQLHEVLSLQSLHSCSLFSSGYSRLVNSEAAAVSGQQNTDHISHNEQATGY